MSLAVALRRVGLASPSCVICDINVILIQEILVFLAISLNSINLKSLLVQLVKYLSVLHHHL